MATKKQARAEIETLIQNLLTWAKEQPEYTTGTFPDVDRKINPVDKLRLAGYAERAKKLCPAGTDWPAIITSDAVPQDPLIASVRNFALALAENSTLAVLFVLIGKSEIKAKARLADKEDTFFPATGLLDALCKSIGTSKKSRKKSTKKRFTKVEANSTISEFLAERFEDVKYNPTIFTARYIEEKTGVPSTTAANTPAWLDRLKPMKETYKKEHNKKNPVRLSKRMASITEIRPDGTTKLHTAKSTNKPHADFDED